jgi:hypothetical protein
MCDIFLRRGIAVPLAPALKRFRTGPFSTTALFTVSESDARLLLFSAFAMALLSVLTRSRADLRGIRHAGVTGKGLDFHGAGFLKFPCGSFRRGP